MEKNNTGKEIKNNSRKLYDSLTKQITEINHYIWVLEYIENKRWIKVYCFCLLDAI